MNVLTPLDSIRQREFLAQFVRHSLSPRDAAHRSPFFEKWRNCMHYKLVRTWL